MSPQKGGIFYLYMRTKIIIITSLLTAILLAILHNLAIGLGWYFLYSWVDIPIHALGGFSVALLIYAVMEKGMLSNQIVGMESMRIWSLFVITFGTLLVSIIWELLELVFYLTNDAGLSQETLSDIIFGIVGSLAAWVFIQLLPVDKINSSN
jgi:hypothetical protein